MICPQVVRPRTIALPVSQPQHITCLHRWAPTFPSWYPTKHSWKPHWSHVLTKNWNKTEKSYCGWFSRKQTEGGTWASTSLKPWRLLMTLTISLWSIPLWEAKSPESEISTFFSRWPNMASSAILYLFLYLRAVSISGHSDLLLFCPMTMEAAQPKRVGPEQKFALGSGDNSRILDWVRPKYIPYPTRPSVII